MELDTINGHYESFFFLMIFLFPQKYILSSMKSLETIVVVTTSMMSSES